MPGVPGWREGVRLVAELGAGPDECVSSCGSCVSSSAFESSGAAHPGPHFYETELFANRAGYLAERAAELARADRLSELSSQQRPASAGGPRLTAAEREARVRELLREREAKKGMQAAAAEYAQGAGAWDPRRSAPTGAIPGDTAAAIRRAAGGAATSSGRQPARPASAPRQRPMSALGITVPQAPPLSSSSKAGRHSRQAVIAAVEAKAQEELTFKPRLVAKGRAQSPLNALSPTGDARIQQACPVA